ncbi:uncharacterized protein LOC118794374 [Megalops cyprinoides]|uniref:uncharacterized protein LOC118794374 n=1 Tax=Megalops cyprinoides TaxID=118141 RepID=UPI001863C95C|nr:uncharacterized protein LOC118794374 [Megalops cyprinoides]
MTSSDLVVSLQHAAFVCPSHKSFNVPFVLFNVPFVLFNVSFVLNSNACRGSSPSPCPPSPTPSVSLTEIKADTRLVLGAFLRHSLSLPEAQRPGRVGGAYKDPNKFSASTKAGQRKAKDGEDSVDEHTSTVEMKHSFKDLVKKHLKPRPSGSRHSQKDTLKTDSSLSQTQTDSADSVDEGTQPARLPGKPNIIGRIQAESMSPYSSTSEEGSEGEEEKKKKKKKKKKSPFSTLVHRLKLSKKESENKQDSHSKRPTSLSIGDRKDTVESVISPGHPPAFYEEVAETLDKIAQKHSVKRRDPSPAHLPDDKEALVQQLVQVLSMQGDAINKKIQSSPFLRSSLTRLSYPSFVKLVNSFASQSEAPVPVPASPTLSRVIMTMEVSRRVITATGTQRIRGFAERYMENFAPWVKSKGGWENIVQLDEVLECD